jgi:hypothetical protein
MAGFFQRGAQLFPSDEGDIFFSEIDAGLDLCQQPDETCSQPLNPPPQVTPELTLRNFQPGLRLCPNSIEYGLCLRYSPGSAKRAPAVRQASHTKRRTT